MAPNIPAHVWHEASNSIPSAVRTTLARCFEIADTPDPKSGEPLAAEIFSPNGTMRTPQYAAVGSAEIARCREKVWDDVSSRFHEVHKVYASGTNGTDLMMTGTMTMGLKDGTEMIYDFWVRAVFRLQGDETAKLELFEGRPRLA